MAKSVLDIIIKLSKQGGADKETITGLVKVKSAMMDAAAVAGVLVAAGYTIKKAFDATVGTMVAYADQVRGVQQTTGLTAEESSRLIQVLDDMKISYDDLQKVVAKSGDQFDYSIQGLARMSDEYRSLKDAQEKADFMQERFGKNWKVFVEAMEQGGDALVKAGESINKGLILDDKMLEQARDYEIQIDNVTDSVEALKVSAGVKALPFFDRLFGMTADLINVGNVMDFLELRVQKGKQEQWAAADAVAAHGDALMGLATAATDTSSVLDVLELNYSDILGMAQRIADEDASYAENVKAANADINMTTDERKAKLDELAAKHNEVTNKIVGDNFLQKLSVDDLTQTEFEMFLAYQIGTGQMTQAQANQAAAFNELTTMAANGKLSVDQLRAAMDLLQSKSVTLTVDQVTNIIRRDYVENRADHRAGYASGTKGWETVPAGFPNDSYPIGLTSGEKFAVIPPGGGGAGVSAGGGGVIVVNLNMNSLISNMDREMAKNTLIPFIKQGIREAQAQGMI